MLYRGTQARSDSLYKMVKPSGELYFSVCEVTAISAGVGKGGRELREGEGEKGKAHGGLVLLTAKDGCKRHCRLLYNLPITLFKSSILTTLYLCAYRQKQGAYKGRRRRANSSMCLFVPSAHSQTSHARPESLHPVHASYRQADPVLPFRHLFAR